ncbi:dynamin family protein [Labedaea rhizosphaerae]|uniref:dynamin family protein n=1 Tax=Labedaea rhizosphaerae TaxID=598644 RepID=UPI001FB810E8|nr:dynamin family protein [Labedaea rhizosphaerae]
MAANERLVRAVELARTAIEGLSRPDLDARLARTRDRLADERVRVLVVGEFKQGKSMLVNGLVGAPVCPVLDDLSTAVPTHVAHAATPSVAIVRETERIPVPLDQLARYACESPNRDEHRQRISRVEVNIPRSILEGGLVLVDTPGVGGLGSVQGAATMAALTSADAVLLVSDASQEYTAPELDFLRTAMAACPNVACVLTKADLYPHWRQILDLDRGHLARAGIEADVFPVSASMRWHALTTGDAELSAESGFPELVRYLREKVLARAGELACRSTVHDVLAVLEQVVSTLDAEAVAQRDPERVQEVIRELTAAEARATALKERSARWQQTLNDGVADLNADIDYDLRDRLREITREAEQALQDNGDPSKTWDQFTTWVQQATAAAASANFVWATQRARWLAGRVAEHFDAEGTHLLPSLRIERPGPSQALGSIRAMTVKDGEPFGFGRQLLTGVRGGYMGMLMFGMFGTLVGFSLLNPITVGAGLLMGRKTLGDERRRIVQKRQADAKVVLRRYIDDVTFHVGKDSRDMLRGVQRVLRDHFTAQADQLKLSLQDSLQAAKNSVKATQAERDARLAEIKLALDRLEAVRKHASALLPGAAT